MKNRSTRPRHGKLIIERSSSHVELFKSLSKAFFWKKLFQKHLSYVGSEFLSPGSLTDSYIQVRSPGLAAEVPG